METKIVVKNVKTRCFWTLQIWIVYWAVLKMRDTMQILQFQIITPVYYVIRVSYLVINVLILLNAYYVQLIYLCQSQAINVWKIALLVILFYFFLLKKKLEYL